MSESTSVASAGGKKKLRAGLVGLGMMGRHHARVLGSLDGVELVRCIQAERQSLS